MSGIDVLEGCDRLRADLCEAFDRATSAAERLALSEAVGLVLAARRALQRVGPVAHLPPTPDGNPPAGGELSLVTEEPPPPSAALSPVTTAYAAAADGSPTRAAVTVGPGAPSGGGPAVDRVASADRLDEAL